MPSKIVSLGHLAHETLGNAKGGAGPQALTWWREGRFEEVEENCWTDAVWSAIPFDFALREGYLLLRTKAGERVRVPTRWSSDELVDRAHVALPGREGRSTQRWSSWSAG